MGVLSHRNHFKEYFYPDNTGPTYFDFQEGCLDIHTLRYRIFGAVWKLIEGKKYILGYWFADQVKDIHFAIQKAGFTNAIKADNKETIDIYQSIRTEQEKENWRNRKKLPFLSIIKKPWKDLMTGWVILKSSTSFPCILTCIQKKRYSIWIEHVHVCENQNDIIKFLNLINIEHHVHLKYGEIQDIKYEW